MPGLESKFPVSGRDRCFASIQNYLTAEHGSNVVEHPETVCKLRTANGTNLRVTDKITTRLSPIECSALCEPTVDDATGSSPTGTAHKMMKHGTIKFMMMMMMTMMMMMMMMIFFIHALMVSMKRDTESSASQ